MVLPKVAVIISNYNYGEFVLEAIHSALDQDYEGDLRVFVVDDGSSDDSWEKISPFTAGSMSKKVLHTPYYEGPAECREMDGLTAFRINNSGASTARNVAIWEAWEWADVFAILDADDTYAYNKISIQVEKLMEYDNVGVTYSDYVIHKTYDGNDYKKYEYKHPYSLKELHQQCIVHSAGVKKKRFLQEILLPEKKEFYDSNLHGPASQGFIGCTEDYDLWLRLSRICMMVHVPQPLSFVRETGQNQSMRMTQGIFVDNMEKINSRDG